MKSFNNSSVRYRHLRDCSFFAVFVALILFFTSCTVRHETYSILEFTGVEEIGNFSKWLNLIHNNSDSINPTPIEATNGDLFVSGDAAFVYNEGFRQNSFSFKYIDSVVYINDKINSIRIPNNENMIPWFENMEEIDLSELQFINLSSKMPESYIPYLKGLAEIKPDAGIFFEGDFEDMTALLKIFKPRYVLGQELLRSDYDMLSGLSGIELLMITPGDSVIVDPLPSLPALKQLFLTELDEDIAITNNFLANNKQVEKVNIQKNGSFDFSMLKPLENLKELVISGPDTILNLDLINDHRNLEILSLIGDEGQSLSTSEIYYNPDLIRLASLRWMTFGPTVTQEQFDSFVDAHPDLEVIQVVNNAGIRSLKALSKLSKLSGLTVTDTVADIATIKTFGNLKYLSLPDDYLKSVNRAELQNSLPDTRIAANEGICLGTGWLLLLIPLVLMFRFFASRGNKGFRMG